ncbi:MAG: DUF3604 domain-containing protein [Deltaproteobacteria bacterium]|nr:DUF3604 domain-containing protein [Deltaproteobacteria bacterium]
MILATTAPSLQAQDRSAGEPGRGSSDPNPLKNVYFGEEHMHTRNSFDAFTAGVSATWDDAYNFAKGEEIKLSTTGEKMKRRTPYDFVAITDHAEYYGVLKEFADPKSELSKSDFAKQINAGVKDPSKAGPAVQALIQTLVHNKPLEEYVTPELRHSMWQKFIATADKHNEPGRFTALYAFEWTSIPNGANMHRNVFFKDKPAAAPFSAFDSVLPEDLWTYLEIQRNQEGIDCFAIPHNSNVSNGWMFSSRKFVGTPMDAKYGSRNLGMIIDARYARRQQANEPLFEIHQTKGSSEAHPWMSPNDEFANFEPFPSLISLGTPSQIHGGFYRQGLVEGMRIETETGFNPYKMGLVAGADVHSGYQGNEEWDWKGAHGNLDDTPQKRLNPVPNATGETGFGVSSAGTTAVWATENTREGIWNGMMSKETYGTTGTLIRLRFFGGWGYAKGLVEDKEFVAKAYKEGVPMGRDLPEKPDSAKAPTFAVWALKDPEGGNLDRIQIIKGWSNPRTGYPAEKIYEVAWSDNRTLDPKSGKLPPVGNTVDIKKATYTNDVGDSQLSVVWTDPDFDPNIKAVYYVRVLEIPTPRWSTYDAVKLGVEPPEGVPATIQERAYSSPIWYTPAASQ